MYTCIWIRDVCYWVLRYTMENSNTLRESYFTLQKKLIKIYSGIWVMTVLTRNDPNLYIYYNSIDTDLRHFVRWLLPFPLICSLAERKNMWLTKVYSERGCSRGHDHMLVGFICYRLKSDSTHHFFRNACTKSGSLRFSQFSGCWLILSVYILMSFDFPFVRMFGFR
jgi:hypothetical protein